MSILDCVFLENKILEILQEAEKQLNSGVVCCKCENPCEGNTRCKIALKNLITDIALFKKAFLDHNPVEDAVRQQQEQNEVSLVSLEDEKE